MLVVINGRVVGPRATLDRHCVVVDGSTIKQVAPTSQVLWPEDASLVFSGGVLVAPGFIDLHVHGALGRDTMEASVEGLAQIGKFHLSGGTTAMTPTVMTDSTERMTAAMDAVQQATGHDFGGAQFLGVHIEGPYVSRERCGAQPPQFARNPDPNEYTAWLDRDGLVTQMTLAPELPGALELIDALLERELLPSGGGHKGPHQEAAAG